MNKVILQEDKDHDKKCQNGKVANGLKYNLSSPGEKMIKKHSGNEWDSQKNEYNLKHIKKLNLNRLQKSFTSALLNYFIIHASPQ